MQHVTLAFRKLFKTPVVTTVAVLSLALGIGANAAIFSLFDQILLRPLPVPEPGRLVNLEAPGPKQGSQSCGQAGECDVIFSYPMFRDLERAQTVFTGLAAHCVFGASVVYGDEPVTGQGMYVSGSYFPTLGLHPALGRLLGPDDDRSIGTGFVAVLSYDYWTSHLGSDRAVLGRPIKVNGQTMTIVGVAPQGFVGTTLGIRTKVFVPITMRGQLSIGFRGFENRRSYWVYVFGRLKPGMTTDRAANAVNALYRPIIGDVEAPLQTGMSEQTMARFKAKQVVLTPGWRGQSSLPTTAKTPLLMLFAVTGIVLLIACANIANLLLARGAGRAMEMGVRLALGASRRQLIAQLLVESVVLALMGGLASLLVAQWTLNGISALLPPDANDTLRFTLQPAVLLFAAGLAVVTGLVFGMFPAWHSTRTELVTTIRAGAGQIMGTKSAARFRSSLVTAQIALATTLLVAAGLFLKSLVHVTRVDLGMQLDRVVTFAIAPERIGYDSTRSLLLYDRIEQELAAIPGVDAVTSAQVQLVAGNNWGTTVDVQGFQSGPDIDNESRYNEIGSGYFAALGVHARGRARVYRRRPARGAAGRDREPDVREEVHHGAEPGGQIHVHERPRLHEHSGGGRRAGHQVLRCEASRPAGVVLAVAARHARQLHELLRPVGSARSPGADPARCPQAHRRRPADRGLEDHAAAGARERVPGPDDQHSLGGVRRTRDAVGLDRIVRCAGLQCGAAHARDRRAHGAGRGWPAGARDDPAPGLAHDAGGRRDRADWGRSAWAAPAARCCTSCRDTTRWCSGSRSCC